jgi:hypothetical protein
MTDERCNADLGPLTAKLLEQQREIARLTAERDEARRMYCGRVSRDVPLDAFDIAKNHGWDCFPQEDEPCSVTPAP